MKNRHDDLGYWAGWFIAFGVAAAFFVYVVWQGATLHEVACKTDEEDCLRAWVSALGGWAAVVVAVPTILFLSRQVTDARHYQQQNMQVQLRRSRAMASRAMRSAAAVKKFASDMSLNWDDEIFSSAFASSSLENYDRCMKHLIELMDNPVFDFVEDEVAAITPINLFRVRELLKFDAYRDLAQPDMAEWLDLVSDELLKTTMNNHCELIIEWAIGCEEECASFLEQSSEMTGMH